MEEIPKAFSESKEGIHQMDTIISAMKDYAYLGSQRGELVDLNRAIRSTVNICRNEWKYVADLKLHLDPQLPPVYCTINEINQVLLNLIINGVQAIARTKGESKKGHITITTKSSSQYVDIIVADSGPGIPEEIRDRIFDPFFTTKGVGEGTGQGLAIAYDIIVNRHGGDLRVSSKKQKGTTFIMQLPLT